MSRPVCIKLISGEELFTEVIEDKESLDQNLLKVYLPYTVELLQAGNKGTQFQMRPWVPFSDDVFYYIPASNIVNMSALDDQHRQMYGTLVLKAEVGMIQKHVNMISKNGIIDSKQLDESLQTMLQSVLKSGLKYGLPAPELDDVKTAFYRFTMDQFNERPEVIQ